MNKLTGIQVVMLITLMAMLITLPWTYDYISKMIIVLVLVLAMLKLFIEIIK